jgi:hypothetical protein
MNLPDDPDPELRRLAGDPGFRHREAAAVRFVSVQPAMLRIWLRYKTIRIPV